ncbi:response regulator [Microvirga vignae]|uniref:Response regulator n=1 Tax=Microvirga vignae TaxID=1225564 RepID=A0A0H1RGS5_9HYPH|nr:response regulator [Microvirga vignae]KLK94430.1 response regulator [Microvirga vignae]
MSEVKPLRILIVEDEFLIALELESLLQDAGHDVVGIAASSEEAIALGCEFSPDLAFVDIHLADGLTGIDVARKLSDQHHVTVLFMTANAKRIPEDFAGARGVIAKPYTERGVKEALAYITAEQEQETASADRMTFIPFDVTSAEDSSSKRS